MIDGFSGVIIWTDNIERLKLFYIDKLGLEPHSVHEDFVAFSFGEVRLSIGVHSSVNGRNQDPCRLMINLDTNDAWKAYKEIKKKGVGFLALPEVQHWGGTVATFEDPDGNILQLMEQPKLDDKNGDVNMEKAGV